MKRSQLVTEASRVLTRRGKPKLARATWKLSVRGGQYDRLFSMWNKEIRKMLKKLTADKSQSFLVREAAGLVNLFDKSKILDTVVRGWNSHSQWVPVFQSFLDAYKQFEKELRDEYKGWFKVTVKALENLEGPQSPLRTLSDEVVSMRLVAPLQAVKFLLDLIDKHGWSMYGGPPKGEWRRSIDVAYGDEPLLDRANAAVKLMRSIKAGLTKINKKLVEDGYNEPDSGDLYPAFQNVVEVYKRLQKATGKMAKDVGVADKAVGAFRTKLEESYKA